MDLIRHVSVKNVVPELCYVRMCLINTPVKEFSPDDDDENIPLLKFKENGEGPYSGIPMATSAIARARWTSARQTSGAPSRRMHSHCSGVRVDRRIGGRGGK